MMPDEYKRTARFTNLKKYDYFAAENDFMEVTEWYNGEGFDVNVTCKMGNQQISMTWGEYKALRALIGNWYSDEDDFDD